MHAYQKGPIIGEGTYGSVICATHKDSNKQVAIKKVQLSSNSKDGVNMSVLRELKALRALAAPCVVELLDTFSTKSSLVLVFEFMEWSLEDVIRDSSQALTDADIKSYMQMLLQALAHVHSHQAVHRDIKPDNLLISSSGQMKLADFGLARFLGSPSDSPDSIGKMTPQVFGRWYRPPELLMGSSTYSYGVDMWAAGCVLAELLLRKPWFPGNCDMDQLDRIFKVLGVPTLDIWPGYADLPHRIDFKPARGQALQQIFKEASPGALDLLQRLMAFDPDQRITAAEALAHPYFSTTPAPTPPAQLPKPAATRLNRLGLSRVPAVIPDMLMPHRLLQQQQQGFSTAGVAAAGWADAGEPGEALLVQHQQQQPAGNHAGAAGRSGLGTHASTRQGATSSGTSRLLAFSDAPSFSGRFLGMGQGLLPSQHLQDQQLQLQQHSDSRQQQRRPAVHFAADVQDIEGEQEAPWKGRLSFSGILDEPTPPSRSSNPSTADAAMPGDENALPAGLAGLPAAEGNQQHAAHRRPSPVSSHGCQQQKGAVTGSQQANGSTSQALSNLRPPLHPSATPVHLRTGQQASTAAALGSGGDRQRQGGTITADAAAGVLPGRQRRGVSDLSAALSSASAAAAAGPTAVAGLLNPLAPLLGGLACQMPRIPQQQQQVQLGMSEAMGQQGLAGTGTFHASTPAAGASRSGGVMEDGVCCVDADGVCPMSLSTSARKRTRAVFESEAAAAAAAAGQAGAGADQPCGDVAMLSNERRVVKGRRSSITSGCCSMETDTLHSAVDARHPGCTFAGQGMHAAQGNGQLCADDRSMSITSDCMHAAAAAAMASAQCQQQQHADHAQQQQRELQEAAEMPPPHAVHPRPASAAAAAAAAGGNPRDPSAAWPGALPAGADVDAAGAHGPGSSNMMGSSSSTADVDAAGAHGPGSSNMMGSSSSTAVPDTGGSTCPMSLDHRPGTMHRSHPGSQPRTLAQGPGSSSSRGPQQDPQATGSAGALQPAPSDGFDSGDLITGGRPPANELRSMDPAELAELAKFWRPRLDSAERRYLRCRTMQLGEALLQASQPDDLDEDPEYHHFPGMGDSPPGGRGLFDTPAKDHSPSTQAQQQLLEQQHRPQQQQAHQLWQRAQQQQQQQQQHGRQGVGVGLPSDTFLSLDDSSAALQGPSGLEGVAVGRAGYRVAAGGTINGSGEGFHGGGGAEGDGGGGGGGAGHMAPGAALPGAFAPAQQQQLDGELEPHGPGVAASAATLTAA